MRELELEGLQPGQKVDRLELHDVWAVDARAGREGPADLLVEDGRLVSLDWQDGDAGRPVGPGTGGFGGAEPRGSGGKDGSGHGRLLVVPGFLDMHAHLREPGPPEGETIASGLEAAAHGGFTRVCAMPNTEPPADDAGALARLLGSAGSAPVSVLPYGCVTGGRAGTTLAPLAELADAGAIAFSDDGAPVADPALLRSALLYAGGLGRVVVQHPEEPGLTAGAEAHDGLAATVLGLHGWPAAAETGAVARDLEILAQAVADAPPDTRPRLHLTHVSCAESVALIRRAKAAGLPVTCDATPHHLALHDGWLGGDRRFAWQVGDAPWAGGRSDAAPYDSATHVNPPLRGADDALALAAGLRDGTVDAIATDHAPHPEEAKSVEFGDAAPGISGLETAFGVLLTAVQAGALDLITIVRALTEGPQRALGLEASGGGSLVPGAAADLVVVDPWQAWEVTADRLRSRGKNTPLLGRRLPGEVLLTLARGRVAYSAGSA
jgi:dihydroorotase